MKQVLPNEFLGTAVDLYDFGPEYSVEGSPVPRQLADGFGTRRQKLFQAFPS